MAFDEALAERVREVLEERGLSFGEIKMFGGLCFTVKGNMALGIVNADLMVRVGPDAHDAAMKKTGARPMDFAGRPMNGFVFVDRAGTGTRRALDSWAGLALSYAATLPPKVKKKRVRA